MLSVKYYVSSIRYNSRFSLCHSREGGNPGHMKSYYVYILATDRNGTLYIGVTSNLIKRVYEHKNNLVDGFTKEHNVHKLVYFEETLDVNSAITREKQLKKWERKWKLRIIEEKNPQWEDLYFELL